ncbi:MAG: hypothetical protein F4X14_01975 [Caldilineaceae bacterium SB0661_bin_32]|uniref:Uncharacterized protein n=1 Tax=Caldilineaceae bacterium SB0661_bin_32 TaxID=2605255 RepID=A0A6B1D2S0_9CHLR|nr:hypothetical protein [Caldilineaceae bacterium SB0661_bin_32]
MIPGATRSRAAILCLGGWGLQTMLHLAPRLHSAQEQRNATGVDGPDLTRITRFAALLPSDQLNHQDEIALNLFTLRDNCLPPFYLERLLTELMRSPPPAVPELPQTTNHWRWATSQRRASLLLASAADALHPLQWQATPSSLYPPGSAGDPPTAAKPSRRGLPWPFRRSNKDAGAGGVPGSAENPPTSPTAPPDTPTRRHAFRAAINDGGSIAHLVASNIIDPIRADTLVPGDPFVQTTLYVIAPLYEPLTSALIWPTIAHQLNYLGQRHIAQVVGIFAAGSYATDTNRTIEDASCYAALAELEAFTGLRRANLQQVISAIWKGSKARGTLPEEWLGRPLFDRIYLVDREKSNQGLARNSYELSVLVGNTVQALIAADGAAYIDEQVGIDLRNASERPYSLLGAAADHVPLDYIFRAAQQHEGKRLVREQVLLQSGSADGSPAGSPLTGAANHLEPLASLQHLGATSHQALNRLIRQMPDLFNELNPETIQDLTVHSGYVLPSATARKLRGLNPIHWQAAFDNQFQSVLAQSEKDFGAGALDTAWGLAALDEDGLPVDPTDNRFLPAVVQQMRAHLLSLIGSEPSGLLHARRQLHQWLFELEQERLWPALPAGDAAAFTPTDANRVERQLELRDWRNRYRRTLADKPSLFGALTRVLGLLSGIVLLTLLYLFGSGLVGKADDIVTVQNDPSVLTQLMTGASLDAVVDFVGNEANAATFIGLMIGAFLGAITSYRRRSQRVQKLRRERVNLACSELTARLQDSVWRGLGRVHDRLEQMLKQMDNVLEQTCRSLQDWAVSEKMPPLPPEDAITSHLYRPHLSQNMWERCLAFMRGRQDVDASIQAAGPPHSAAGGYRGGEGRLRAIWTTPQRLERLAALFTGQEVSSRPLADILASHVRESAQAAVGESQTALPEQEPGGGRAALDSETEVARKVFVRSLAQEYNLEHLLWRDTTSAEGFASLYPDGEFTPVSTATLRYLETMWNAAKPSANYDVSDRLAAHGVPVEFAAVSGNPDSDLTEDVMQSLRIPRLLTGNPFQIAFVRTLHGLELRDLGSMTRYLTELGRMDSASRQQILLTDAIHAEMYNQQDPRSARSAWS